MNIWDEIEKLKGQTLRTLDQRKPFEIIEVDTNELIIYATQPGLYGNNSGWNASRSSFTASYTIMDSSNFLERARLALLRKLHTQTQEELPSSLRFGGAPRDALSSSLAKHPERASGTSGIPFV